MHDTLFLTITLNNEIFQTGLNDGCPKLQPTFDNRVKI